MTIDEMINMEIDPGELTEESEQVGDKIKQAAIDYAKLKIDAEQKIQPLKVKIAGISSEVESPIDYNKTQIKQMPLAADSLKMNVQYFSFDENKQDANTFSSQIKSFISGESFVLGKKNQAEAAASVQSQINSQYSRHSIAGTLVISITCTHKNAVLLAPFILNVDKAINVWNRVYPNDMIKPDSIGSIMQIAAQADTAQEKSLTLLSGATYGSCFIGMVHILNTTTTQATEKMYALASSLQAQATVGCWWAYETGGIGIDDSFANDAKNLLSTQNISSHCTLTTIGSIPSIKSNSVDLAVDKFASFGAGTGSSDPMKDVVKLQNATASDKETVMSAASAARTGGQMVSMKNAQITGVLTSLAKIDDKANKILDINSMMDAMDDYIKKASDGKVGAPINYYLKPITKSQLAQMWVAKYYPNNNFLVISGDDSSPSTNTAKK